MVEDELAEEMIKGVFGSGDHILGDVDPDDPDKMKYSKIPSVEPPAAACTPGTRRLALSDAPPGVILSAALRHVILSEARSAAVEGSLRRS